MKNHWKKLLIAGGLTGLIGGGLVYWNLLRVDPEYAAQEAEIQETMKSLDSDLGIAEDDDFDLDKELEDMGVDDNVSDDDIDLD